ncbi:MAG: MATE family efflux transporter [Bacteroides sp.]|nr:MATE family efflux transporter [Bacteroides sp.]
MTYRDRQILQIALPSIVSNITVPLLGLVDVTIVGHLGAPAYIGAIAVGGMLFNIICWIFSFLRMGTSGMTSQAYGKRDLPEVVRLLIHSVGIGLVVGLCFIVLQVPVRHLAFLLVHPTEEVRELTTIYFHICIWGVPAMLGLYGLSGWFIGMQNSRIPMLIAITQNVVNIVASLCLVFLCGMKVEGVATGTVIAQYAGFVMGLLLWWRYYGRLKKYYPTATGIWERSALVRFFTVNRDIFLRTLCLVSVTLFFTSAGASQGEIVLAVNTLLMQFFMLFSFVMDGFAYAGEALSGRFIGACNRDAFMDTLHRLFVWGGIMTALFTLVYALGGTGILSLLTNEPEVIAASDAYFYWALAIPVAGITAFIWDSIFIGATATRGMLISMAIAAACFFGLYYLLRPVLGNHALWLAFITYLFMRGAVQTVLSRGVIRRAFAIDN